MLMGVLVICVGIYILYRMRTGIPLMKFKEFKARLRRAWKVTLEEWKSESEEEKLSSIEAWLEVRDAAVPDSVVGEYEVKKDGATYKLAFQKDVFQKYKNGEKQAVGKWYIVKGEIYLINEDGKDIVRINPDKSITYIAMIDDGKRIYAPKEIQTTFKKIK